MTVGELIERLLDFDSELPVVHGGLDGGGLDDLCSEEISLVSVLWGGYPIKAIADHDEDLDAMSPNAVRIA